MDFFSPENDTFLAFPPPSSEFKEGSLDNPEFCFFGDAPDSPVGVDGTASPVSIDTFDFAFPQWSALSDGPYMPYHGAKRPALNLYPAAPPPPAKRAKTKRPFMTKEERKVRQEVRKDKKNAREKVRRVDSNVYFKELIEMLKIDTKKEGKRIDKVTVMCATLQELLALQKAHEQQEAEEKEAKKTGPASAIATSA